MITDFMVSRAKMFSNCKKSDWVEFHIPLKYIKMHVPYFIISQGNPTLMRIQRPIKLILRKQAFNHFINALIISSIEICSVMRKGFSSNVFILFKTHFHINHFQSYKLFNLFCNIDPNIPN